MMRHIISILLENEAGALSRVAGLFSARGYNIESLTVAPTWSTPLARTWKIDWDWHREYMTTNIDYGVEARLYDQNEQAFACIRFIVRYNV